MIKIFIFHLYIMLLYGVYSEIIVELYYIIKIIMKYFSSFENNKLIEIII
jgi:hypothetical protein